MGAGHSDCAASGLPNLGGALANATLVLGLLSELLSKRELHFSSR